MAITFKRAAAIYQEMADYVAGSASVLTDLNLNSALRSLLETIAVVVGEVHWMLQELVSRFFVVTSQGQWLERRAEEVNVFRTQPRATSRVVTVTHASGAAIVIPVDTIFETLPAASVQVQYRVVSDTTLPIGPASIDVPVVSMTTGAATAIPDGETLRQTGVSIAGIDTIVTSTISVVGLDLQDIEDLRAETLLRMRNPAGPGSKSDLVEWALQVDGVGSAVALSNTPGLGYATVLILGPANVVPDPSVVSAVQAYIDPSPSGDGAGKAAVGAQITVAAPATVAVDVQVTIVPGTGFDGTTVRAAVQDALESYLDELGMGVSSKIAALGNVVWDTAGVGQATELGPGGNYIGLKQRTGSDAYAASDISIPATSKVIAGTVTVS